MAEFEPIRIGEIFPFEKPTPGFDGDSVKTAFGKLNSAFENIGEIIEATGTGGGMIDTNIEYSDFFRQGDATWKARLGTFERTHLEPNGIWTAPSGDSLYYEGPEIDTQRFTNLIVTVERISTEAWTPNQRAGTKTPSRPYNYDTFAVNPLRNPTPMEVGERMYISFDLTQIPDWYAGGANGLQFRLSTGPGTYRLWAIKLVGPDSSEVQLAAVQADIAAALAEAAAVDANVFKEESKTYMDASQGYAADSMAYRNQAENFKNESEEFSIEAEKNSLVATASGRFAHYLKPLQNGTFTFDSGIEGFTSNGTLTHSGGSLQASVPSANGYIQTPNLDFDGSMYSRIMVRMKWISGTLDPSQPFKNTWLYYNTSTRPTFSSAFEMRPLSWEVLKLNDSNIINLYFDASEQAGTADDWFSGNPIRSLRLYPAIDSPSFSAEFEYFYILGDDVNYPYSQAQASATSAIQAAAFENAAEQWAGVSESFATSASTSAAQSQAFAGQSSTSATTAAGWAAESQSYAILSAQASPGLQLTMNPVFMDWPAVNPAPTGMTVSGSSGNFTYSRNIIDSIYSPQCLDVNVTSSASDGNAVLGFSYTQGNPKKIQLLNARYYVLEADVELISGSLSGAGFYFEKYYASDPVQGLNVPISSNAEISGKRYLISKVLDFGDTPPSDLTDIRFWFMPNFTWNGTPSQKRVFLHKMSLRLATENEAGSGVVQDLIDAAVAQEAALRIAADNSIEGKYTVKINANGYVAGYGLIATGNTAAPTSEMVFQVDKFKVATAGQTPKQMFTVGQVNGTTTMVLNGDMIADGSVTAKKMIITDWTNLIPDSEMIDRSAWQFSAPWSMTPSGGGIWDTPGGFQFIPNGSSGWPYVYSSFFPVSKARPYRLEAQVYTNVAVNNILLRAHWADYNGNPMGDTGYVQVYHGVNLAPGVYHRLGGDFTPPSGAFYCRIQVYINDTPTTIQTGGALYLFGLSVKQKSAGSLIVDGTITSDKLQVNSLSAITANLGAVNAGSININGRFILGSNGTVTISSASSGQRLVFSSSLLQVFDANNVERVRLGIW